MARRKNPKTFDYAFTNPESEVTATALFEVAPDGSAHIVRLTFEGPKVTGADIRDFPLAKALEHGQREAWEAEHPPKPLGLSVPEHARPDGTDAWYEGFAALFMFAKAAHPLSPAQHVAADFHVPVTTVHRWTREARRRGYLPPDPRGKKSK